MLSAVASSSEFTLGATASLTANAYQGYYLSVDGSGEQRKIETYSSAKVCMCTVHVYWRLYFPNPTIACK